MRSSQFALAAALLTFALVSSAGAANAGASLSPSIVSLSGSLVAWGYNEYGQTDVPAGNDFTAVAAGAYHNVALKSDGSLAAWGSNIFGETNVPSGQDFVAVAAGGFWSLALKSDGSLVAWGLNQSGELNVPAGNDFVEIAAGGGHGLALRSDGSLVGWGSNSQGQADVPGGNDFIAISGGQTHSVAIKSDGSLVAWGDNFAGQLDVPSGNDFTAVSGVMHGAALRSDGSVVVWGNGVIPGLPGQFTAIGASWHATIGLRSDGTIAASGYNYFGELNVPTGGGFIAIAAGYYHNVAIKAADSTPPTVSVTGVVDGATYVLGNVPIAGCTTTDDSSGVATDASLSATGGTSNGVGAFMVTCSGAVDNAGNEAPPVSIGYTVVYDGVSGILEPINPDNTSIFSRGKAIPVKLRLTGDPSTGFDTSGWTIQAQAVASGFFDAADGTLEDVSSNTPSTSFRYDPITDQYIYNADMHAVPAGSVWRFKVSLDSGQTLYSGVFKIK